VRFFNSLLFITFLLLSGCSYKEVYEPKTVVGEWEHVSDANGTIVDKTSSVALLSTKEILTKEKRYPITLENGFRILGVSDGYVITTNIDGVVHFNPIEETKQPLELQLEKTVAAASTDGMVAAIVFASGKLALYDLITKEPLVVVPAQSSVALDSRIVNPYFMNDLVLFLTLDGKVVIVSKTLKKKLRTIIVSSEEFFNNIIYFDLMDEKLIVATATKILSFGTSQKRRDLEARELLHDGKTLYVATKQGDIYALDSDLNTIKRVHFPFAHFLGLQIKNGYLYALEKEGYMIVLSKDLLEYKVYEADFDDEANVFALQDSFLVGEEQLFLGDDANISQ